MNFKLISSTANDSIKRLARMQNRRGHSSSEGLFFVEGEREISRAIQYNYACKQLFISENSIDNTDMVSLVSQAKGAEVLKLTSQVFEKISVRESHSKVVGLFERPIPKSFNIEDWFKKDSVILAFENLEKPGNLGAILRSADGAGIATIVLLNNAIDEYNPNVIRASLGSVFAMKILRLSSAELVEIKTKLNFQMIAMTQSLQSRSLWQHTWKKNTLIVFGNEGKGVSQEIQEASDIHLQLPMNGIGDSLNVSVTAGIVAYDWLRQNTNKL